MNRLKPVFRTALHGFRAHRLPRLAAALAYYTLFSLAPLLVIMFGIAGFILGDDAAAQMELFEQMESAVGEDITSTIRSLVEARDSGGAGDVVATAAGGLLLFVGASGLFAQLQDSLNTVWDVPLEEIKGVMATIRKRIVGFIAVVLLGVLLIVFVVGSTAVAFFASEISERIGGYGILVQIVNPLIAYLGVSLIVALVFKFLPAADVPWRAAWRGGSMTTLLMAAGSALIGVLFGFSDPGSSFGQFAAIIVLLVYIYYIAQIFFLGAEFTSAVVKVERGEGFRPVRRLEDVVVVHDAAVQDLTVVADDVVAGVVIEDVAADDDQDAGSSDAHDGTQVT